MAPPPCGGGLERVYTESLIWPHPTPNMAGWSASTPRASRSPRRSSWRRWAWEAMRCVMNDE
eukprot:1288048-Prymnesium_polylepis.1